MQVVVFQAFLICIVAIEGDDFWAKWVFRSQYLKSPLGRKDYCQSSSYNAAIVAARTCLFFPAPDGVILKARAGGRGVGEDLEEGRRRCRRLRAVLIEPSLCLVTAVCRGEEALGVNPSSTQEPRRIDNRKLNKTETCRVARSGSLLSLASRTSTEG